MNLYFLMEYMGFLDKRKILPAAIKTRFSRLLVTYFTMAYVVKYMLRYTLKESV
jgi:amino acid permease